MYTKAAFNRNPQLLLQSRSDALPWLRHLGMLGNRPHKQNRRFIGFPHTYTRARTVPHVSRVIRLVPHRTQNGDLPFLSLPSTPIRKASSPDAMPHHDPTVESKILRLLLNLTPTHGYVAKAGWDPKAVCHKSKSY